MTTRSVTCFLDAVNHRWRGSRSGDKRMVCRDDLMLEQRVINADREQRWLRCVEARPKPGSRKCKLLNKEVRRTHSVADLTSATTPVSTHVGRVSTHITAMLQCDFRGRK